MEFWYENITKQGKEGGFCYWNITKILEMEISDLYKDIAYWIGMFS